MKTPLRYVAAIVLGATQAFGQSRVSPAEPGFDPAPLAAPPPIGRSTGPDSNGAPPPAIASPDAVSLAPRIDSLPTPGPSNSGSVNRPPLRIESATDPARDAELAALRKAALQGTPGARNARSQASASWVLGLVQLHGLGLPASQLEAANWFERAYGLGEPLAAAGLAWCEIEGCRGPPNPAAARLWIDRLRPANPGRAQFLQWLLAKRLAPLQLGGNAGGNVGNGMRPNPQASPSSTDERALLLGAPRAGDVQARIELGFESVAANRPTEARDYFLSVGARSAAAVENATLLSAQRPPALTAGTPAGKDALAGSTFALAQKNHRGEGQPANFTEAIRLYRQAQNQGSAEARKMLALIFSRPAPDGQLDIAWMQRLAYADVSGSSPVLGNRTDRPALRRDPTPLFDLLPPNWRT